MPLCPEAGSSSVWFLVPAAKTAEVIHTCKARHMSVGWSELSLSSGQITVDALPIHHVHNHPGPSRLPGQNRCDACHRGTSPQSTHLQRSIRQSSQLPGRHIRRGTEGSPSQRIIAMKAIMFTREIPKVSVRKGISADSVSLCLTPEGQAI